MSYPNDTPAAAWYPDPQTPGQVRWWDGTNWTEHVSVPAEPVHAVEAPAESIVPQVDHADAALAAADAAHVTYIGRHAAGAHPAPRQAATAPRIRPRERAEQPVESLQYA